MTKRNDGTPQTILSEIGNWLAGFGKEKTFGTQSPRNIIHEKSFGKIFRQNLGWIGLLSLLATLPYLNSLNNAFISDDVFGIVQNKNIGDFGSALASRSLSNFLNYFNYSMAGFEPFIYHATNIILHASAVILVFLFIFYLTNRLTAIFAAGLFAVHPIHTEAVSWVSGRPYLISSVLMLLALLFYIAATRGKFRIILYLLSAGTFFLSLFGAWLGLTFVLILVLYEFCFGSIKKYAKFVLFYIGLTILYAVTVAFGFFQMRLSTLNSTASAMLAYNNPALVVSVSLTNYVKLLIWPADLSFYQEGFRYTAFDYWLMGGLVLLGFLSLVFIWRFSKLVVFSILLLPLSISPTFASIFISWVVAERYIYFGSIGFAVILGLFLAYLYSKVKYLGVGIFILLILIYSWRIIIRNQDWKDADTLWFSTVKTTPLSPKVHNNLGDYYIRQNNVKAAISEFETAIAILPSYAEAYHNLGSTLWQIGETTRSAEMFSQALAINPKIPETHNAMGMVYYKNGLLDKAEQEFLISLQLNPNLAITHNNLAIIYYQKNEFEKALQEWETALILDPGLVQAKQGLELLKETKR